LTYDVPAGCPGESEFLDRVARDGGQLATPSESGVASFLVQAEGAGPVVGRLVVRQADGSEVARELQGARCEDVVRSLAVLLALLAPKTTAAPGTPAPETPQPGPLLPENPQPGPANPESARPGPPVPTIAAPDEASPTEPETAETSEAWQGRHGGWRLDVSSEATFSKGATSSTDPALAAYVELLDETPKAFAPAIRLGGELGLTQSAEFGAFRRIVGRADACVWHGVVSRPWSDDAFTLTPCARIDVGRIEAETTNFPQATVDVRRLWIAPAALLRLRWTAPHVFLEVEGGIEVPLVRERFFFDDALDAEVPPVTSTIGVGFGWFFL
jgi:hypothetical protein